MNAVHVGEGLYKAEYVCRFAANYTVTVTLLETEIIGSGYSITVLPGEISSAKSNTDDVNDANLALLRAGETFLFNI